MISVTPESVKSAFCVQIPGVCRLQGKSSYILVNLPFWRPFCLHSYFIFIFLLEAKFLQLDSNFIANNLREKMGLRHFSIPNNFFYLYFASILDAILDISKCSMMPEWHHSDSSRTIYALLESTKKKSLKSSSRSS